MKTWVQFLVESTKGKIVDALGSDGMYFLDGRNTLETQIQDSIDRMEKMKKYIHSNYCGFEIRKGHRLTEYKVKYKYIADSVLPIKKRQPKWTCHFCGTKDRNPFESCPVCNKWSVHIDGLKLGELDNDSPEVISVPRKLMEDIYTFFQEYAFENDYVEIDRIMNELSKIKL